jgi:hypothetical protein
MKLLRSKPTAIATATGRVPWPGGRKPDVEGQRPTVFTVFDDAGG